MSSRQSILIDSDVFVGLFKKNDAHYSKVKQAFQKLKDQNSTFFVSNFVFSESITVISQKVNHKAAVGFIHLIKDQEAVLIILRTDEELDDLAIEIFKKQTSKNVSFVDCINMALLKQKNIDAIWSFDEIYKKNGFKYAEEL